MSVFSGEVHSLLANLRLTENLKVIAIGVSPPRLIDDESLGQPIQLVTGKTQFQRTDSAEARPRIDVLSLTAIS